VLSAGWSLVSLVTTLLARRSRADAAEAANPELTNGELRRVVDLGVTVDVVLAILVCLICVVCARHLRAGRNPARITATVTLAVVTMLALAEVTGGTVWSLASFVPAVTAILGIAAIVWSWSPAANRHFVARR
jgi:hypothetical protein